MVHNAKTSTSTWRTLYFKYLVIRLHLIYLYFTNRTVVKSDAEAAIKGKQWMLSCYGPFKDKPSLPNFEDQSFEEIRSLCYEAKNNGNLQALLPQLSQQAADASYKISMLCDLNNVNNNLLNMLVNLYNSGESTASNPPSHSSGNPFAISSSVSVGGQSSSLFGNSSTSQQQNPFGSSLFGSTAATPSSSIFGGGGTSTTNTFFGQQSTFGGAAPSVFGGQNAFSQSAPSSFGSSTFGQASASPFSLGQIGQSTESSKPSSIFGASQFQQTQNSIFGAPPAFGNQIPPAKPSLFATASTNSLFGQNQNPTPSGLFGQPANNQPANGLFGSFGATQPQPPSQSLFGSATENKSIFGQSANTNQNVFVSNQQQQQQQMNQSPNIFANALSQQQNNSQNVFGVQHQQEQQSIFSQSNSNTGGSSIFQNQTSAPAMGGSIFGGNSGFGQSEQISQSAYSRLEDLRPEDLECFTAVAFIIGKIPTVPPPQELCV